MSTSSAQAVASTDDPPWGIQVIASPPNAVVDIVFVHGLTGHRTSTWTHPNGTFSPSLLAVSIPNAAIMTYGYDAAITKFSSLVSSNSLRANGTNLAYALADHRRANPNPRPLVFIAHSLGGLVVEQALLISRGSNDREISALLPATTGILFMGTPHAGSDLAVWGGVLAKFYKLLKQINTPLLKVLEPQSEVLLGVEREFQQLLQSSSVRIRVFCVFEGLPVAGVGSVVSEASAVMSQYPNASIRANHMDMTKFRDEGDEGFKLVLNRLLGWIAKEEEPDDRASNEQRGEESSSTEANDRWQNHFGGTGSLNSNGGAIFQGSQVLNGGQNFSVGPRN